MVKISHKYFFTWAVFTAIYCTLQKENRLPPGTKPTHVFLGRKNG